MYNLFCSKKRKSGKKSSPNPKKLKIASKTNIEISSSLTVQTVHDQLTTEKDTSVIFGNKHSCHTTRKTKKNVITDSGSDDTNIPSENHEFVPLPWFLDTMASVELSIKRDNVPLICGPVGCGKTSIIDYIARKMG